MKLIKLNFSVTLITFEMLNSYMELVTTILDNRHGISPPWRKVLLCSTGGGVGIGSFILQMGKLVPGEGKG